MANKDHWNWVFQISYYEEETPQFSNVYGVVMVKLIGEKIYSDKRRVHESNKFLSIQWI